jgi:hypothetical protein
VRKFLVLMTDGANTRSKTASQPEHNGTDKAAADALTAELCQNIKSANIKIFTIAFEVTDTATQTLLSNCSSGPPFYFTADNGAELTAAFEQIAQSVVAMRVSR